MRNQPAICSRSSAERDSELTFAEMLIHLVRTTIGQQIAPNTHTHTAIYSTDQFSDLPGYASFVHRFTVSIWCSFRKPVP
jgi:hypothetical protein